MPYTQYTQSTLAAELSAALNDKSNVYWTLAEVYAAIDEALLTWGALTAYWRERGVFNVSPSNPDQFYDLSVELPTLRSRALTFDQYAQSLQYSLNEVAAGVSGVGMTEQFDVLALNQALVRKRNEFAIDSKLPSIIIDAFPGPPPPVGRLFLPQEVALIEHLYWKDTPTGLFYPLRKEDPWAVQSHQYLWTLDPGLPSYYLTLETRPLEIQLVPPPQNTGTLRILCVATQDIPIAGASTFNVPDEYMAAVKYGALYDLLSTHSEGYDPMRAKYCLERYNQMLDCATTQRSLMRMECNGIPVAMDAIANLNALRPFWQNQPGTPDLVGVAYDQIAVSKTPNAIYSLSADVVRSAPLPTAPGDFIQLGREEIPYIFDYCRHILCFKLGGSEFASTMPLYDNFLSGAMKRNKILAAKARYLTPLMNQATKDDLLEEPA
jgi:hypothetical protein